MGEILSRTMGLMRVLVHEVMLTDDCGINIISVAEGFCNSEQGQWLKQVSYKPMTWIACIDALSMSTSVKHFAWLTEQDLTFYRLKWK